jgi:hypothetical protein
MRFTTLFFVVYLTACVSAGGLPNAYERMWIWYAYSLDLRTGSNTVMPNCRGSSFSGTCLFREVMEALDGTKYPNDQILANEYELNPDVRTTAQSYFDRGFVFDFPPRNAIAGATSYPDMIEKVANAVAHAKATISPENLAAIQHIVDSCDEALKQARGFRVMAFSDFMLASIKENLPSIAPKLEDSEWGKIFSMVNTIKENPAGTDDKIMKFFDEYTTTNPTGRGHWAVVRSMNMGYNTQRGLSCSI